MAVETGFQAQVFYNARQDGYMLVVKLGEAQVRVPISAVQWNTVGQASGSIAMRGNVQQPMNGPEVARALHSQERADALTREMFPDLEAKYRALIGPKVELPK